MKSRASRLGRSVGFARGAGGVAVLWIATEVVLAGGGAGPVWAGPATAGPAAGGGAGAPSAGGAVTLPLAQFEELRARAQVAAEPPAMPPAPFAILSDQVEIAVGPSSAAVLQRLTVRVLSRDWVEVPLGDAGSLVEADLGGLEGQVQAGRGETVLRVRGAGDHQLRLSSAVAVAADSAATRPAWRFALRLPVAAVVHGRLVASPALAGKVEDAALEAGGFAEPGSAAAGWSFAGEPGRELRAGLLGRAVVPERARLPLRFEATSASSLTVSRTRLKVRAWVQARVAQGSLPELVLRLPQGLVVEGVTGTQVAGWKVADGALAVTPFTAAEDQLTVEVELSGAPVDALAAPLLVPAGAGRTTYLARAAVQGDGLLEVADRGSTRPPDAAEIAPLGDQAAAWTAGTGGKAWLVGDAAQPPRWHALWAERTEVLAAQIDQLWLEVAAGEAGRATYQVWALVRNRGSTDLELLPPAGFELRQASRDGVPMPVGMAAGGGLTMPLLAREAPQVIHLSGLVPLQLPTGKGELAVPLPALSAPAARIDVRLLLPAAGRAYALADRTRAAPAAVPPPSPSPSPAATGATPPGALGGGDLAAQVRQLPAAAAVLDRALPGELPQGFVELNASWSALSATPGPLAISVMARKDGEPWF